MIILLLFIYKILSPCNYSNFKWVEYEVDHSPGPDGMAGTCCLLMHWLVQYLFAKKTGVGLTFVASCKTLRIFLSQTVNSDSFTRN